MLRFALLLQLRSKRVDETTPCAICVNTQDGSPSLASFYRGGGLSRGEGESGASEKARMYIRKH